MTDTRRSAHRGAPAHKARDYAEQNPPEQPENRTSKPGTPHNPVLSIIDGAGEDAELWAVVGGVLDALEAGLDVEGEGLDLTGEAVLGQPLAVI